MSEIAIPDTSG